MHTTLWTLTDLIFPPDSRWALREVVAPSKTVVVPVYFRMNGVDGVRGSCHCGFDSRMMSFLPPLFLINGWAEQHVAPVVAWRWISEDSLCPDIGCLSEKKPRNLVKTCMVLPKKPTGARSFCYRVVFTPSTRGWRS